MEVQLFLLLLTFYLVGSVLAATIAFNTASEQKDVSIQEIFYVVIIAYLLSWSFIIKAIIHDLKNA